MTETMKKNRYDPCSEFNFADLLSGSTLGVPFEGAANFLIDFWNIETQGAASLLHRPEHQDIDE